MGYPSFFPLLTAQTYFGLAVDRIVGQVCVAACEILQRVGVGTETDQPLYEQQHATPSVVETRPEDTWHKAAPTDLLEEINTERVHRSNLDSGEVQRLRGAQST